MDLINDLGTDLALAFIVEKRYRQKIETREALALIARIQELLAAAARGASAQDKTVDAARAGRRPF